MLVSPASLAWVLGTGSVDPKSGSRRPVPMTLFKLPIYNILWQRIIYDKIYGKFMDICVRRRLF